MRYVFAAAAVLAAAFFFSAPEDASACGRARRGCQAPCEPWIVCSPCDPQFNPQPNPQPNPNPLPRVEGDGKVRILLIGLTKDATVGPGAQANVVNLKLILEKGIPAARRDDARVVTGDAVTAANILAEADKLEVKPADTVFCYYTGHGGYDPAHAAGDPSGGHVFSIQPSGDLLRKTLFDKLKAKGARLTVLITDTCNVKTVARLKPPFEAFEPPANNPILMTLLLRQTGVVDVSGSSRDQYGWFYPSGGWFTLMLDKDFVDAAQFPGAQSLTWKQFLGKVADDTSALFHANKQKVLDAAPQEDPTVVSQLKGQDDQRPQVFQLEVKAAAASDSSAAPARIVVQAPEGARLYFDDAPTVQDSATRVFTTPALSAGRSYSYALRLETGRNGRTTREEKKIVVRAGEETRVDFTTTTADAATEQPSLPTIGVAGR